MQWSRWNAASVHGSSGALPSWHHRRPVNSDQSKPNYLRLDPRSPLTGVIEPRRRELGDRLHLPQVRPPAIVVDSSSLGRRPEGSYRHGPAVSCRRWSVPHVAAVIHPSPSYAGYPVLTSSSVEDKTTTAAQLQSGKHDKQALELLPIAAPNPSRKMDRRSSSMKLKATARKLLALGSWWRRIPRMSSSLRVTPCSEQRRPSMSSDSRDASATLLSLMCARSYGDPLKADDPDPVGMAELKQLSKSRNLMWIERIGTFSHIRGLGLGLGSSLETRDVDKS